MFFFKKKPIYLDCYTTQNHVHNFFKIESTKKYVPDWFRNLPSTFSNPKSVIPIPTAKTCSGIINYFKSGFVIPLWTDAQFGYTPINNGYTTTLQLTTQFADQTTQAQVHVQDQIGNEFMPNETYLHFKVFSPWAFKCSEDIEWLWTQPTYNFKYPDELIMLPGSIEFKHNSNVFINFSIRKHNAEGKPNLLTLNAGQPLVQLTPVTEREVVVRNHLVDVAEWQRIYQTNNRVFFFNNHNKKRNLAKQQAHESKCPFGFK